MDEQKKQEYLAGCQCFMCRGKMLCGKWHWHGFLLLKLLVGIIILIVIFAVGVKIGELKSVFGHGRYGHRGYYDMMSPRGVMPPYYYGQQAYPPMMQRQGLNSTTTNPIAPTAPKQQ